MGGCKIGDKLRRVKSGVSKSTLKHFNQVRLVYNSCFIIFPYFFWCVEIILILVKVILIRGLIICKSVTVDNISSREIRRKQSTFRPFTVLEYTLLLSALLLTMRTHEKMLLSVN